MLGKISYKSRNLKQEYVLVILVDQIVAMKHATRLLMTLRKRAAMVGTH
jgi:hypothetical protein